MREKWLPAPAIFLASPFFCSIPLSFPSNACYNTFVPLSGISDCSVWLSEQERNVVILWSEETVVILTIEVRAKATRHDVRARQLAREIVYTITPTASSPLNIRTAQLYRLSVDETFTRSHLDTLISQLLIDPVVQEASVKADDAEVAPSSASWHQGHVMLSGSEASGLPTEHGEIECFAPAQHDMALMGSRRHTVDVFFHAGVTDTLAESVLSGARLLGIPGLQRVETGQRYLLDADLSEPAVRAIAQALLYNPVIQDYELHLAGSPNIPSSHAKFDDTLSSAAPTTSPEVRTFPLSTMSDEALLALSKEGMLALNLDEMHAIQAYFRREGREPTDVELETLAQTWSEHCSHKTFRAEINYRELDTGGNVLAQERIPGLLRHYLMRATEQVRRPWVVSAFRDNAGVIRFTEDMDIAFKVETHNHPSAIEPFGGANTGVGGVIRDVLGVSAQPIACTDVLCFGPPQTSAESLPVGVLPPRRIASGVVSGVRDYGNKMGIPTVNGAVLYNEGYIYNPLVFCGCLGMLPHGSHPQQARPGDLIVVLGGRTGRDGIHGATFSSGEMSSEVMASAGSAVQIGAPITEKKVTDVILAARDRKLYTAITDCGAGGFSSAIGEMGAHTGARVELADAPLKYAGLAPWEIWLSEAQERMVLAVPPAHIEELRALCAIEEVEATVLGTFTDDHRLIVTHHGHSVANLDMSFLHEGRPARTLEAVWTNQADPPTPIQPFTPGHVMLSGSEASKPCSSMPPFHADASLPLSMTWNEILLALLAHPTIASKEDVVRRYDHEVQGATVLKPLVGRASNGPGDAAVLQPIIDEPLQPPARRPAASTPAAPRPPARGGPTIHGAPGERGGWGMGAYIVGPPLAGGLGGLRGVERQSAAIILSNGINPLYGRIDPYQMALNAVDEALRNLTAVGGDIERAALLDNFCWGNPNDPRQLGMLVRAVRGCYDAAVGFGAPFISGKDSLNNEYRSGEQRIPVIPTLLISAVGIIDDAARTIDMSLKAPGNLLYLLGTTRNELAASHYAEIQPLPVDLAQHTRVPHVDVAHARTLMNALSKAIRRGLVQSCHDLSEGGLALAAAEMSLAGLLGMNIDVGGIGKDINNIIALFSESPSRFLVEIAPQEQAAFESFLRAQGVQDMYYLGIVTEEPRYIVRYGETVLIDVTVDMLQSAWKGEQA
jgi:phosphoribosylformylglycinamidine synthase